MSSIKNLLLLFLALNVQTAWGKSSSHGFQIINQDSQKEEIFQKKSKKLIMGFSIPFLMISLGTIVFYARNHSKTLQNKRKAISSRGREGDAEVQLPVLETGNAIEPGQAPQEKDLTITMHARVTEVLQEKFISLLEKSAEILREINQKSSENFTISEKIKFLVELNKKIKEKDQESSSLDCAKKLKVKEFQEESQIFIFFSFFVPEQFLSIQKTSTEETHTSGLEDLKESIYEVFPDLQFSIEKIEKSSTKLEDRPADIYDFLLKSKLCIKEKYELMINFFHICFLKSEGLRINSFLSILLKKEEPFYKAHEMKLKALFEFRNEIPNVFQDLDKSALFVSLTEQSQKAMQFWERLVRFFNKDEIKDFVEKQSPEFKEKFKRFQELLSNNSNRKKITKENFNEMVINSVVSSFSGGSDASQTELEMSDVLEYAKNLAIFIHNERVSELLRCGIFPESFKKFAEEIQSKSRCQKVLENRNKKQTVDSGV